MPQSPSTNPRLGNATASELANLAADEIGQLISLLDAYVALQKFLFPEHVDDSETVVPTRSELSALLRTLNDALGRQLEALAQTLAVMQQGRGVCIHVPGNPYATVPARPGADPAATPLTPRDQEPTSPAPPR